MSESTFQRVEKKYLLGRRQLSLLLRAAKDRIRSDEFGSYTIQSLYYDTDDYALIRRSIEKPVYKEKLRLRIYGSERGDDGRAAFVELKKKFKGVVYKRRAEMPLKSACEWLDHGRAPEKRVQIEREIGYFLSVNALKPSALISYERTALYLPDDSIRLTLDKNILFRAERLSLYDGIGGERLIRPDETLMEIKLPDAMPVWMARLFSSLGIFPVSFSKYGTGYKNILLPEILGIPSGVRKGAEQAGGMKIA